MERRCTESSCRRTFPIPCTAPVRCPYCGTAYPRVLPDPRSPRETYGYSIRADFTSRPHREVAVFFPGYRSYPRYFWPRLISVGHGLSLREAQDLCRRFRLADIPADVITTWDARRQQLPIFRV